MSVFAQHNSSNNSNNSRNWGAEVNLVWPFVPGIGIYNVRFPINVWANDDLRGDFVLGTTIRPNITSDENAEKFSEYGIGLGYRHYLWEGIHLEPAVYFSYAQEIGNKVDGKDYAGLAITTEMYAGYTFDIITREKFDFYTVLQAGVGGTPYQDLGPPTEEGGVFLVISLLMGVEF